MNDPLNDPKRAEILGTRIPKSAMTRIMDVHEKTSSASIAAAIDNMLDLPLQELGLINSFADMIEEIQMSRRRKTGND